MDVEPIKENCPITIPTVAFVFLFCLFVVISFILDVRLHLSVYYVNALAEPQAEYHTGFFVCLFFIHLPSAVSTSIFYREKN